MIHVPATVIPLYLLKSFPMQPISVTDDGLIPLEVTGHPPVMVDLYEVHDSLAAILRQHGADPKAYYAAARDYLAALGLPQMSARAVTQIANGVFDRVAGLKKSDLPTPLSETPA